MVQYCIYLRKSRGDIDAELRGEGETLARHEKILIDLASTQSLNVIKIYKEIVSGESILERPIIQKLLLEIESGLWAGVLVIEIERLARGDTIDQGIIAQAFKYSNTKIITPTKTYNPNNEFDEEYFEFGLFMSRREYKTINRRLQSGRVSSVKEGKYVGNQAPYGYIRKKIENDKGFTLEPHPQEADVIKTIYELYTKGEIQIDGTYKKIGLSLICKKLNYLNIKPRKSDSWVISSVRDIITNPVYNGKIRWNFRPSQKKIIKGISQIKRPRSNINDCIIVDGIHKPLVDSETWNLAQDILKNKATNPTPNNRSIKNPLSGIMVCGLCGRRMVRRGYTKKDLESTLMCPVTFCTNISSKLHLVESSILNALQVWLINYKLNLNMESNKAHKNDFNIKIHKKALKKINKEILVLENQINNLHNLLEQGVYTASKFLERSNLLADKLKIIKNNKHYIEKQINIGYNPEENKQYIIPKMEMIIDVYPKTKNLQLKNDLLKEVLGKVIYTKTVNTRWQSNPDNFQIDLYPKLPKNI